MKNEYISEAGRIDSVGRLLLPMDRLNAEFAQHKNCRVVARFSFTEPGSSAALLAYYYGYVVSAVRVSLYNQGTRATDEKVDNWLVSTYPGDIEIEPGRYAEFARELSQAKMLDFLEWLKQFAAENLDVYVEDPKSI